MIQIPSNVMREVYDHMESSYPHECCGLLIGALEGDKKTVHTFRKCKNLNTERAHDRYEMDPLCMLKAQREFENGPWDIIGIYHSHPDHPSRASQTDTDRALDAQAFVYSFVIVSIQKGKAAGAQSWVLHETERRFFEEPLQIADANEGDRK